MLAFNLSKVMVVFCLACWYADGSSSSVLTWVQLWLTSAKKKSSSPQFCHFLLLIWRFFFFSFVLWLESFFPFFSFHFYTFHSNKIKMVVKEVNFIPQKTARWKWAKDQVKASLGKSLWTLEYCFQYMDIWYRL